MASRFNQNPTQLRTTIRVHGTYTLTKGVRDSLRVHTTQYVHLLKKSTWFIQGIVNVYNFKEDNGSFRVHGAWFMRIHGSFRVRGT